MAFWETVLTGVISGVVAAAVIGIFAAVWRTTRPTPAFTLTREVGTWILTRTDADTAINVQWSIVDRMGALMYASGPTKTPPDMAKGDFELVGYPLMPDDQMIVFWGDRFRTNSHAVTVAAGVVDYDVWPIGKRPARRGS